MWWNMYVLVIAVMIHLNAASDLRVDHPRFCWRNASLPPGTHWPCDWSDGRIPYTFNLYSLKQQSCLKFEERNPVELANRHNATYLVYTYSEVLEYCCHRLFYKPLGRRNVLITPLCSMSVEIAHATLHGLGLHHKRNEPFDKQTAQKFLFLNKCKKNTLQNYKVML
ncbi:uncharacterized protein LOC121734318 isoform X2 [Aricia agestis]|uniref:uncharacterized protein LOC121734318 isoform X2 n=1 Tax=Aricia agestis TaxID=91739 RepID=UPI001C20B1AA|nr:uncharacterized protein LOC121734318 isoform X2 [Aricia agestis]